VSIGDNVTIISGMYKGEKGVVSRAIDAKREVGVKLKGYTGTGTFHITEVEREVK
jgi:transcription antitermination factor NusG